MYFKDEGISNSRLYDANTQSTFSEPAEVPRRKFWSLPGEQPTTTLGLCSSRFNDRLPKLKISHMKNVPYKVLQNLVKISLTKKLKIKFTYLEFALCLSLVCILGTI